MHARLARLEKLLIQESRRSEEVRRRLLNHVWLSPLPAAERAPYYLSAACIARNEGPYLREWLEYHRLVGVEHFYFYDNESDDQTRAILEPYISEGIAEYRYVEGRLMQIPVYNDAVLRACGQSRWLALIDLDEFIVPVQQDTVPDFLRDYEQYYGVCINWVCFDCNGHDVRPAAHGGLVTANYTRTVRDHNAYELDRIVKCIVQPSWVTHIINPHKFRYKHSVVVSTPSSFTEDCQPCDDMFTPVHRSAKIRINHYLMKSRKELAAKVRRGNVNKQPQALFNSSQNYASASFPAEYATTQDTLLVDKYLSRLKSRLGIAE